MRPMSQAERDQALRSPGGRHILTILGADPVERMASFYASVFGWPRRVDVGVYVEFELPDGRGLGIYRRDVLEKLTGRTLAVVDHGAVSGAELYFHCQDLEVALLRLEAFGAPVLSALAPRDWGDEAAYYADPEGNILVVARPLEGARPPVRIRPIAAGDRPWIEARATEIWGGPGVVSEGRMHFPGRLEGLVAEEDGHPVGLVTFRLEGDEAEIVTVDAFERWIGIGTQLMAAAEARLREAGCKTVRLITTNDNLSALQFYQRRGYALEAVHAGAIAESRKIKPSIPLVGESGIPIRDELVLTKSLD